MSQVVENLKILKRYGSSLRSAAEIAPVKVIKSKWPSLNDVVLGCGGWPRGRSIELYGPPSVGKSTVMLNIIADIQNQSLAAAYDDREGTFPGPEYTNPIGVKRNELGMVDSSTGENAIYEAKKWIAFNAFDVYVIDSLANCVPSSATEVENDELSSMHDNLSRAKLLADFFTAIRSGYEMWVREEGSKQRERIESDKIYYDGENKPTKYIHKLQDKDTIFFGINHMKVKPGQTFGDATATPGGEGGKFDASIRLQLDYLKKSKEKDKEGRPRFKVIRITAKKNKVAPPFGSADFILWQDGRLTEIDQLGNAETETAENDVIDDNVVKIGSKKKRK